MCRMTTGTHNSCCSEHPPEPASFETICLHMDLTGAQDDDGDIFVNMGVQLNFTLTSAPLIFTVCTVIS
jgi:hypothetical protein